MNNRLNNINNSEALTKGRSQYVGTAADNSIIMEIAGNVIAVNDGEESPSVFIMQKVGEGQTQIADNNQFNRFKSLHLPPQIEEVVPFAFSGCIVAQKLDIRNLKVIGESAFSDLGVESGAPLEIYLDKAENIAAGAFVNANANIYLNENVQEVQEYAFEGANHLYYYGNLEGAPWGAKLWN